MVVAFVLVAVLEVAHFVAESSCTSSGTYAIVTAVTTKVFKPFSIGKESEALGLRKEKPYISFVDAFDRQLKELFLIDNPQFVGRDKQEVFKSPDFERFVERKGKNYQYFFYPWNQTVVKCVQFDDYLRLKTNRNRDLITAEEQKKLYNYRVAVLGMSVGSNIAFVLTQAGISGKIILADLDQLETTNLNRILAGVHQVGLNKAIVAARRIYEDNPYAEVRALPEGISEALLRKLLRDKEIDCIVEEIDNVPLKIGTRRLAREYRVPVVMVTDNGDGVVLHVERYDLGYDQLFEKSDEYWDKRLAKISGPPDLLKIIVDDLVGGREKVDPRMLASVKKVLSKKLVSWPQLGSAALLGGVVATYAIKQIALGQDKKLFRREYIHPRDFFE